MRVAGFLLYFCFLLVRPEEIHYRNSLTHILKAFPTDHQQSYYFHDSLWLTLLLLLLSFLCIVYCVFSSDENKTQAITTLFTFRIAQD